MERLTEKREADAQREAYERRIEQGYPRNIPEERFLKLAAYEDTGLTPEEIRHCLNGSITAEEAKAHYDEARKQYDEWFAWKQAEADGRLLALPCKVGDPVYYLTGNPIFASGYHFSRIESTKCDGFYFDAKGLQICLYMPHGNHGTYGYFGKTIFLTREEAAKALKEHGST